MLKKYAFKLAVFYTVILGALSLIKIPSITKTSISHSDKILHFIAYALLTLLWYIALSAKQKKKIKNAIYHAALFSVVFGIIIEVLQNVITKTRVADYYDVLANFSGVVLTVVLVLVYLKTEVK